MSRRPAQLCRRLTLAAGRMLDGQVGVAVVARFTLLAVLALRVVQTLVTDAAADATRRLVDGRVEVTARRVAVTLALCKHIDVIIGTACNVTEYMCSLLQDVKT